jgi:predicted DNA-binding transcriptional regulator AlpA
MAVDRLAYRVGEFAEAIGVSRALAYELIAQRKVPSFRLNGETGAIRVPVEAAKVWMESQLVENAGK